jgi:iron complex transport system substrate-binding protein
MKTRSMKAGLLVLTAVLLCPAALMAGGGKQAAEVSEEVLRVPAPGYPLTITDALGRSVTMHTLPARIVSLSPAVTEILFAIGAGDALVGVTEWCTYPPEAATRTVVGGFSGNTVNVELLATLRPDVVILSAFMHEVTVGMLSQIGIESFAAEPRNFEQVYQTIETLGRLTGHAEEAIAVAAEMRSKIDRAAARSAGKEKPRVFWELTDDPLMSTGGDTFISEAITLGGGENIFADLAEEYPVVSAEQVLLRQPQWIIAGDDHGVAVEPEALARRPGWSRLPAVQEGHVATVNADQLYRYGPRLADAVLELSLILHGD